jgi:DNA polymerase-1
MIHAIDTETNGLYHHHGHRAFCVSYTDMHDEPQVVYIGKDNLMVLDIMLINRDNSWVGHNIGFDLPFLADYGMAPSGAIHDTMIMAHIYNNLEPEMDLSTLAKKYCNIDNPEERILDRWFAEHGYNQSNRHYDEVPEDILNPYTLADVKMTLALYKFYASKGVLESPAYQLEMRLVPVVAAVAARGMRIDKKFAQGEFDRGIDILAKLETQALQEYQIENLNSTAQLADALFTRGGLVCTTFTDKKNICLDEDALQEYEHPLVELVLEYREVSKMCKTYLSAVLAKSTKDERLHSNLRQVAAKTGRFSSSDPNLQNIPRYDEDSTINIREAFIASPDCKLLFIDLSQIELRILAHYSKEPKMIASLTPRNGDIHGDTSREIFGDTEKEHRTVSKTLNFGLIYGGGGTALARQINHKLHTASAPITTAQAKHFKAQWLEKYPCVQQFIWDVQAEIMRKGYVFGRSGRRYHCPKDKAYKAVNYLIQGESAMLLKRIMVDIEAFLKDKKTKLINCVHDELIFDLHKDEDQLVVELLRIVEQSDGWRVPIYANADISSTSWAKKEKYLPSPVLDV